MREPTPISTLSLWPSQANETLIVEHIIKIRCPICRNIIGSTESSIVDAGTLMEAARQIKRCPVCNGRVRLDETT